VNKLFIFILFLSSCSIAQDVSLINALPSDFGKTPRTPDQKKASVIMTDVVKSNSQINGLSLATTNMNEGNIWYRLYDDMKIYAANVETKTYLGSWPINTFNDHLYLTGEYSAAVNVISEFYGEESVDISNPLSIVTDRPVTYMRLKVNEGAFGCYPKKPLRYGDLDGDNQAELVIFIDEYIIVFSPQRKKIVMGMHYYTDDEMTNSRADELEISHSNPDEPQYLADSTYDSFRLGKTQELFPAWRSLTKMYFGSFETENSKEIILWRKLYKSRLVKDSVTGFEKNGEIFIQYKLIDGEYKRQSTPSDTIKGWLAAKNLTWQKGYPSKNECPGQEGQLIPEMHDPLLNDPDVLR